MLVIEPQECIDCGVCVAECPVGAIQPDTEEGAEDWVAFNAKYAKQWPNITTAKAPPKDAKEWDDTPNKMEHFDSTPGEGDTE